MTWFMPGEEMPVLPFFLLGGVFFLLGLCRGALRLDDLVKYRGILYALERAETNPG